MRDSIKQELWGKGLIRTWDELGYMILQNETGVKYEEAIDVPNKYTYSETDEKIPVFPEYTEDKNEETPEPED